MQPAPTSNKDDNTSPQTTPSPEPMLQEFRGQIYHRTLAQSPNPVRSASPSQAGMYKFRDQWYPRTDSPQTFNEGNTDLRNLKL